MKLDATRLRLLGLVVVALTCGVYAALLLAACPGYQPGADSHYHFLVGREISRGTFVPDVAHGLPFTVLHDLPVDHYWGYHLLLAPFGWISDAETGMKAATVVLFAGAFAAIHLFLSARRVAHAWVWALLPLLFSTPDWRSLQLRGGQLSLPLLVAMTHVAFFETRATRRRLLLLLLSYVAMVGYHGGLVLLPFHVAGIAALGTLRRSELGRGQVWEPAITAAGVALGLTVNPYMDGHASTWRFAALHVGDMGRDTAHLYDDQLIAEFHGFPAWVLVQHPEWLALLLATIGAVAWVVWRARDGRNPPSREAIVLSGMALAGIALTAEAMRTREYSVSSRSRSLPCWRPSALLPPAGGESPRRPRCSSPRCSGCMAAPPSPSSRRTCRPTSTGEHARSSRRTATIPSSTSPRRTTGCCAGSTTASWASRR